MPMFSRKSHAITLKCLPDKNAAGKSAFEEEKYDMLYRFNNQERVINLVNLFRNLVSIPVFVKSSSKKLEQGKPPK